MTNTIQKLITILSEEGEQVTFIKQSNETLYFTSYETYSDETTNLKALPFTTDENETGYEVWGIRNGHTFPVTTIHASDLI